MHPMPSMMTAAALLYRLAFSAAQASCPCAARMLRGEGQIRFFLVYPSANSNALCNVSLFLRDQPLP